MKFQTCQYGVEGRTSPGPADGAGRPPTLAQRAFTLLEMLMVITIIGMMAALAWPNTRALTRNNSMRAATRQMMDDLAQARLKAMSTHSTVYMVFLPPTVATAAFNSQFKGTIQNNSYKRDAALLSAGQYASYALYSPRSVGDQPGRSFGRYLTEWRKLPDGVFIATNKFSLSYDTTADSVVRAFNQAASMKFPFPSSDSPVSTMMPYVAFDSRGQLVSETSCADMDAVVPLAIGSIFVARDTNGQAVASATPASVIETPPYNSISNYHRIRINWATGRNKLERLEITNTVN